MPTYKFNIPNGEAKLKELILHIAHQCFTEPNFGAVKLNKLLWWSDFHSYALTGKPITGVEYQKLENGPAPRMLVPIRQQMVKAGDVYVHKVPTPIGHQQHRLIPFRDPDYDILSKSDIVICDHVMATTRRDTAEEVSLRSHGKAWQVVEIGERIPYEAVFLSDEEINESDIARTKELAVEFGW